MNEWRNEWVNEWMSEWMSEWMNEWTNEKWMTSAALSFNISDMNYWFMKKCQSNESSLEKSRRFENSKTMWCA